MTQDKNGTTDFSELSEEEIEEVARQTVNAFPEFMTQVMGMDLFANADIEVQEFQDQTEEWFLQGQIQDWFLQLHDVEEGGSSEEQLLRFVELYESMVDTLRVIWEGEEVEDEKGSFEWLLEKQWTAFEGARKALDELGYAECFDLLNQLACDIINEGKYERVKEFYDENVRGTNEVQIMLQRMMNPIAFEYFEYISEHSEITERDEAEEYMELYHELAGLYEKLLPQFVAVLEIYEGNEPDYGHLSTIRLGNLMGKLGSKQYEQYSIFVEGFDREIRNSIAHKEYTFDPVDEEITFRNQGEVIDEFEYEEFQEVVWGCMAVVYALWIFQSLLLFYRMKASYNAIEELRED